MTNDSKAIIRLSAEEAQKAQAKDASAALWRDDDGVAYPYADLHAVAAPIQRGEVDILAGDTGMGKTTLVCSMIERWLENKVQLVYNGSELPPKTMRAYLALIRLGENPGPILSGEMKFAAELALEEAMARGERFDDAYARIFGPYNALRKRVAEETDAMGEAGFWENLHIVDADFADAAALKHQGDLAMALERPTKPVLCIVDHIDHLPDGDLLRESKKSLNTVKHHAKTHGTRWLLTSQLNRTGAVGGDTLWRHRPVQEPWIASGKHKTTVAWRVMGVYRPLRVGVTAEELKAVREGRADVSSVVWNGVNAINFVKHRHFGSRVGSRVLLGWEHGRIIDAPSSIRLAVEAKAHGISTSRGFDKVVNQ